MKTPIRAPASSVAPLLTAMVVLWLQAPAAPAPAPNKAGTTLSATKTATAAIETRTLRYDWTLSKSVDRTSATIDRGKTQQFTYKITACRTAQTPVDTFKVRGEICVKNGGNVPTEGLIITDVVQEKIGAGKFVDLVSTQVDVSAKPVLGPGESHCYFYETSLVAGEAGASYRNVARVTITNHSGSLGANKGPEVAADISLSGAPTNLNTQDAEATVTDTPGSCTGFAAVGGPGTWSIQESDLDANGCATKSFTVDVTSGVIIDLFESTYPACGTRCSLSNTATLTEGDTSQQRTAQAAVTLITPAARESLRACVDEATLLAGIIDPDGFKSRLLELINEYRQDRGLQPVARVEILETVAQNYSELLKQAGTLDHNLSGTPEQRIARSGYSDICATGENLATGASPEAVFNGWRRSREHNAILLEPTFNHIGLGVVAGCSNGRLTLWWTADFGCSTNTSYGPPTLGPPVDAQAIATELLGYLGAVDAAYCAGDVDEFEPFGNNFRLFVLRWRELGLLQNCELTQRVYDCITAVLAGLSFPTYVEIGPLDSYMTELWFGGIS